MNIGRYRVTGTLGEGGMGVVYAAVDDRLNRPLASKMIRQTAADPQARDRFWREARAAASVNHPNVCRIYEIGEEDGALFIAMELIEGESLEVRLRRGALPIGEAVQIALGVLSALAALRRQSLVHRDLKPSNVFVTPSGIKLLDFGIARTVQTDLSVTDAGLTAAGAIVGTPGYMAPEQVLGEAIDERADLFSAAIVL